MNVEIAEERHLPWIPMSTSGPTCRTAGLVDHRSDGKSARIRLPLATAQPDQQQ
jgi:hypothetical protein